MSRVVSPAAARHGCGLAGCCTVAASSGQAQPEPAAQPGHYRAQPEHRQAMIPITDSWGSNELMAGLVPDRGPGTGPAVASRYLCRLACHPSVKPGNSAAERTRNRKRHHQERLLAIRAGRRTGRPVESDERDRQLPGPAVAVAVAVHPVVPGAGWTNSANIDMIAI